MPARYDRTEPIKAPRMVKISAVLVASSAGDGRASGPCWGVNAGMVNLKGQPVLTWLPQKVCRRIDDNTFCVPEWLAHKKGLKGELL